VEEKAMKKKELRKRIEQLEEMVRALESSHEHTKDWYGKRIADLEAIALEIDQDKCAKHGLLPF
jgi:hypothetical protein